MSLLQKSLSVLKLRMDRKIPEEKAQRVATAITAVSIGDLAIVPDEGHEDPKQSESYLLLNQEGELAGAILLYPEVIDKMKALAVDLGQDRNTLAEKLTEQLAQMVGVSGSSGKVN